MNFWSILCETLDWICVFIIGLGWDKIKKLSSTFFNNNSTLINYMLLFLCLYRFLKELFIVLFIILSIYRHTHIFVGWVLRHKKHTRLCYKNEFFLYNQSRLHRPGQGHVPGDQVALSRRKLAKLHVSAGTRRRFQQVLPVPIWAILSDCLHSHFVHSGSILFWVGHLQGKIKFIQLLEIIKRF